MRGLFTSFGLRLGLCVASASGPISCGFADPGSGTGGLAVTGALACDFAAMQTQVRMDVAGTPEAAHDAVIVLTDADTQQSATLAALSVANTYGIAWPGYHPHVQLRVVAGAHSLAARLAGPGIHTLVTPRPGAQANSHKPLRISWAATDGVRADGVTVAISCAQKAHGHDQDLGHDTFAAKELVTGLHTVTVTRTHTQWLAGGRPGSQIAHSYAVSAPLMLIEP